MLFKAKNRLNKRADESAAFYNLIRKLIFISKLFLEYPNNKQMLHVIVDHGSVKI